jgi:hypothetical protein
VYTSIYIHRDKKEAKKETKEQAKQEEEKK